MILEVKWCGFDFGQCIMDPGGLRNPLVFGDIYKELGKPELVPDKIRKYRILKDKYGTYGRIKEGHRDEIHRFVLDDDLKAIELFGKKEQEYLSMAEGLEDALEYLQSQGIELQVISEMKKTLGAVGTDLVSRFLKTRGLLKYFKDLITPQGRINLQHDSLDPKYKGCTKEDGSIYDVLAKELRNGALGLMKQSWSEINQKLISILPMIEVSRPSNMSVIWISVNLRPTLSSLLSVNSKQS